MVKTSLKIIATCAAASLAACGTTESPRPSLEEDLAAIAAFNGRYLQAINDEDIAALSALTTEGHIMLAPNRAPIVGKVANDEANGRAFEQFDFDETWTPVETVVSGDWAYQRGTFTVIATPKAGGDRRETGGSFLRIYQRQPDGEWRMIRDMFNSGGAPPQAAPRTPWGDPDIEGYYTNKYEYGTPFERPAEFEGRRAEDVTAQELAEVTAQRQQDALDRAPFFGGDPEGRIGNSAEFRDIYEVTKGSRAWFVTDPPDGQIPPVLPEARARLQAAAARRGSFGPGPFNGPEDFTLWERCITRGLPGSMLPGGYGNSYQIVQSPGYVAIRYEMVHETRVVPLDGSPHLPKSMTFDMGDARGHWEGETLVVETTNFRQRSAYLGANADTLKLVERFTRTSPTSVEWSVTVDDPSTWARPWTFSMPLTQNEDEAVELYECHEGNHAIFNVLSGARATERQQTTR